MKISKFRREIILSNTNKKGFNRYYISVSFFLGSIAFIFTSFDTAIFTNFGNYILQGEELVFIMGVGCLIGSFLVFFNFFRYLLSTGEIEINEKDFTQFRSDENHEISNHYYYIKKENNKIKFMQAYFVAKKLFLFTLISELYIIILIGPTTIIIFQNIFQNNWSFFTNAFNLNIIFGFADVFFIDFFVLMILIIVFVFQFIALNGLLFKTTVEFDIENRVFTISRVSRINLNYLDKKNKILKIPLSNLNTLENSFDELTVFSNEQERKQGYLSISSTNWEGDKKLFKTLSIKGGSRIKLLLSTNKNFIDQIKNYLLDIFPS